MTSGGKEVGDWEPSTYTLSRVDPATFLLSAEGVDLTFRPSIPDEFAIASLNNGIDAVRAPRGRGHHLSQQAPPAKPLTLVLFYLLLAGTVGMAAWALVSIIN